MDKYYSYTDFLKAVSQQSTEHHAEKLLNEIYLDLFISRLQRMQRIEQLKLLIDTSLDQKNEQAFLSYTTELKELLETVS
ncbi:IDEAL domain-containing protein [Solibacillus isronensis]|uniref:IDEAL domain-containing protein n=1 Tax=Solibacillus isronensis TaxID=412383 RepID=UPI00203FD1F5|nr:IDEAL domain-containing protein [Solibacillus isronensis]MCM3722457.1 IDEAL domain-containing protein [Solibacillus isronensis]